VSVPLVIWGASGHARVLREFVERLGFRTAALFDNARGLESPFPDVPLHIGLDGFSRWRAHFDATRIAGLVAIGGSSGAVRREIQELFAAHGIDSPSVVHPTAFVAGTVRLGAGTQVLAQSAICADAVLGAACIVNTRASIDHECRLGDGVHVAPGATLAGLVQVGANTLIGAGAVVLPRIVIGSDAVVGAGAVVTHDVADGEVVVGNPARRHG
jgi:sugar O-acyltransferase (sialic acid O-acetyltransferase NeuD family)